MTTTVETLLVELDSNTAKLRGELRKGEQQVEGAERKFNSATAKMDRHFRRVGRAAARMRDRIGSAVKSVFTLRNAMIGVAAATGAAIAIERTVNAVNTLGKSAKTADLSAESLQELTFAFGQLADVTDKDVTMSFQRFSRRLGLAADETGAAKDTFGELGVEINDANGKIRNTEEVLDEVLAALANMESSSRRSAKASEIFGEDAGPRLATALGEGIDSLNDARKMARDLGLVLSDDLVAGSERAADEIDILKTKMGKDFQRLILENHENIVTLTSSFIDLADAVISASAATAEFLGGGDEDFSQQDEKINDLNNELERLRKEQQRLLSEGNETVASFLDSRIEEVERALRRMGVEPKGTGGGGPSGDADSVSEENEELSKNRKLLESIDQKRKEMIASGELTSQTGLTRGGNPFVAFGDAAEESKEKVDELGESTDDLKNNVDEMEGMTRDLGFTFKSAFENAIVKGKELSDVLRGLVQDITRIFLRTTVTGPMSESLASGIAGLFSGNAGGASLGVREAGAFGGVRANGGPVSAGTSYLVGERGRAELFTPKQDGTVMPISDAKGAMGGNQITIDARGANKEAIVRLERVVEQLNRSIEPRAIAAVSESRAR